MGVKLLIRHFFTREAGDSEMIFSQNPEIAGVYLGRSQKEKHLAANQRSARLFGTEFGLQYDEERYGNRDNQVNGNFDGEHHSGFASEFFHRDNVRHKSTCASKIKGYSIVQKWGTICCFLHCKPDFTGT